MSAADPALVDGVRGVLAEHRDEANAAAVQRYLRSRLPCHGLRMADMRRLVRGVVAAHPPRSRESWEGSVRALADGAGFREEKYAAAELCAHRTARAWQDPQALPLYVHLVTTGAWWDLVDPVATGLVGPILLRHRAAATPLVRDWMVCDDLWLRRTAVIAQLQHKGQTDTTLLTDAIEANLVGTAYGSEFFIRKAIGWALRQHARVDPDWVRRFVDERRERLSPLSIREATKHLGH